MAETAARQAGAPSRSIYAGLFLVTLATVMYEVLLTRIFSVTMWYHFAFVAISLAMFGMTVGALEVYFRRRRLPAAAVEHHLGLSALMFSVTVVLSFLTHLSVPFTPGWAAVELYSVVLTYAVMAVPFVFSGICVCLALTRFPSHVGGLYAVDLLGAALGCVLVISTLETTDGPTAVIVVAAVAGLGAVFFLARDAARWRRLALATTCALVGFAAAHTLLVWEGSPWLRLRWVKQGLERPPIYEKWNSFSRITVTGDPRPAPPMGWGLSALTPRARGVRQLTLVIDAGAGTLLTGFNGDLQEVEHLKYDVTNLPHYLRRDARVLAVGPGGGRDILSALVFEQQSVVGVELNGDIVTAVNEVFGEFTGHLDRNPRVTFVVDEARSWVARQRDRFDIIQLSLIDTWAATAAGAFVLSENSLYTREAWRIFLERLTPRGVLAVSRWYMDERPDEVYRLTALASAALRDAGVANPGHHLAVVRHRSPGSPAGVPGIATLLATRAPLSGDDLATLAAVAQRMAFDLVLSPRGAADATLAALANGRELERIVAEFPVNIAPPTDDSPFFFHMLRVRHAFDRSARHSAADDINMKAVSLLGALFITVLTLTGLCIVLPLLLAGERAALRDGAALVVFFAAIGVGFMLIEISQMQRLIIFLGHPTYGLAVVLFALLVASGLGSGLHGWLAQRVAGVALALVVLIGSLAVFGLATPPVLRAFGDATTPVRILVAVGLLFPPGLFMGMAFPLGMRVAAARAETLTPWLWGVNGAASVLASVLAVIIALSAGISVAFWTGVASYLVGAFAWARAATRSS